MGRRLWCPAHPLAKQAGFARQRFDLSRCGIIGEVAQGTANSLADGLVECLVLLTGTRGQLNLIGGHPRLAFGQLSVNVGEPVGTPVIGFPLGECFFCDREISRVFQRLNGGTPSGCDAGRHDRSNPPTTGVGKVDHLAALSGIVGCASQMTGRKATSSALAGPPPSSFGSLSRRRASGRPGRRRRCRGRGSSRRGSWRRTGTAGGSPRRSRTPRRARSGW